MLNGYEIRIRDMIAWSLVVFIAQYKQAVRALEEKLEGCALEYKEGVFFTVT